MKSDLVKKYIVALGIELLASVFSLMNEFIFVFIYFLSGYIRMKRLRTSSSSDSSDNESE